MKQQLSAKEMRRLLNKKFPAITCIRHPNTKQRLSWDQCGFIDAGASLGGPQVLMLVRHADINSAGGLRELLDALHDDVNHWLQGCGHHWRFHYQVEVTHYPFAARWYPSIEELQAPAPAEMSERCFRSASDHDAEVSRKVAAQIKSELASKEDTLLYPYSTEARKAKRDSPQFIDDIFEKGVD